MPVRAARGGRGLTVDLRHARFFGRLQYGVVSSTWLARNGRLFFAGLVNYVNSFLSRRVFPLSGVARLRVVCGLCRLRHGASSLSGAPHVATPPAAVAIAAAARLPFVARVYDRCARRRRRLARSGESGGKYHKGEHQANLR